MFAFVIRRSLWIIPVVLVVSAVTFALMVNAPGGPWDAEKPMPASAVDSLNRRFGLDKPQWINWEGPAEAREQGVNGIKSTWEVTDSQFLNYIKGIFTFDLGPTYESRGAETVQQVIARQFPISVKIGAVALTFALLVGIPLGTISALRQNSFADYVALGVTTLGISVPTFVSGLLLLITFSRVFNVSPIRRPEAWQGAFSTAYIMPGIVLGLGVTAYIARLTRASVLEMKRQDFVRTARAKGVNERNVVIKHVLKNALLPVVTIVGPAAADLVTGSLIIETIFNAPGLGRTFVQAIGKRDYSVVMGVTVFYAVLIAVANILVDVAYGFLDPRLRSSR